MLYMHNGIWFKKLMYNYDLWYKNLGSHIRYTVKAPKSSIF